MRRSHRSLSTLGLTAALTLSLAGLAPSYADPADPTGPDPAAVPTTAAPGAGTVAHGVRAQSTEFRSAQARKKRWPTRTVVAVTAEDTPVHPSATPAQQLKSARLTQNVVKGTFSATVKLRGRPTANNDSLVRIAFGKIDGNWCVPIDGEGGSNVYWAAAGTSVPHLVRNGATMKLKNFPTASAGKDRFDCAFAETWELLPEDAPEDQVPILYSGRGDFRLARTLDRPKLRIKAPKRVAAKVNRWTTVKVKVRNANRRVAAPAVKVSVKGTKVASRTVKVGKIKPGKARTAKVRFKVAAGAPAKAKIVVRTRDVTKRKVIRVR